MRQQPNANTVSDHRRTLNVALAPGECFDELREAHKRLRAKRDDVGATWRKWDERTL